MYYHLKYFFDYDSKELLLVLKLKKFSRTRRDIGFGGLMHEPVFAGTEGVGCNHFRPTITSMVEPTVPKSWTILITSIN